MDGGFKIKPNQRLTRFTSQFKVDGNIWLLIGDVAVHNWVEFKIFGYQSPT